MLSCSSGGEAVGLKEASLVPVQVILLYMLNPVFDLCVPNEKNPQRCGKNPQRR